MPLRWSDQASRRSCSAALYSSRHTSRVACNSSRCWRFGQRRYLSVRLNIAKPRAWHGLEAVLGPALSLAHIENKPCLEAPHNIVGSLFTPSLFAPKKRWLLVYIRLVFACRKTSTPCPCPRCLGVFNRSLRLERPDIEKKCWKEILWSLSYFARKL